MDDFGTLVYLDVQKTSSTFISQFLADTLSIKRLSFIKHGRIGNEYSDTKSYFISVRDPFEQYLSLFKYGCDGKGGLFQTLKRGGREDLYRRNSTAFEHWLNFVLSADHAHLLGEGYDAIDNNLIGFQSFRFLILSFQHSLLKMKSVNNYDDLRQLYETQKIHKFVVRNENINHDLRQLISSLPQSIVKESLSIRRYLRQSPKLNISKKLDIKIESLNKDTIAILKQKERFLFETFYPD